MPNPFDQFDAAPTQQAGNPFDQFDAAPQPVGAAQIPGSTPMAPDAKPEDVGGATFNKLPGVLNPIARAATGAGETGLAAITGMLAPLVGVARGEKGAENGTTGYEPKTAYGRQYTQEVADALHKLEKAINIPGLSAALGGIGGEMGTLGRAASIDAGTVANEGRIMGARAGTAGKTAAQAIKDALPEKAIAAGNKAGQSMGAAKTAAELLRDERAQQVGVKLSKGQKSRDFGQIQFERETAKTDAGAPLRINTEDNNEAILRQFDRFADETGATAPDLRTGGKIVDAALVTKVQQAKSKIRAAYKAADESGETAAPVSHGALTEYIGKQGPTVREKLAPILSAVEDEIKANDPKGTGQMTIKQAEEVRKLINKNAKEGTPDMVHGIEMKKIIDQMTDGAGGDLYKKARGLRASYAREFEDKAAISKLLRQKPGTTDRAVALEDIHKHSILDGSADDVREIRRTLQTGGEEGMQAWKELQGATINHLKDIATKSVQTDSRGNRVISPAAFDKAIKSLDSDGKLDIIFGKKGAGQLRDLNQTIMDAFTSPPGSVNSSNTSSAIMNILNKVETSGVVGGIDKALGLYTGIKPLKYAAGKIKDARTARRVEDALK